MAAAGRITRPSLTWFALAIFLVAEFMVFDQFGVRRHTWIYPRWNDQIQYLTECYLGYEYAKVHGLAEGLWQTLINPSAQGTLHDFFALLVFSVAGPSRSAALSLNMLAFLGWQVAFFAVVWHHFRSRILAWTALALTLWIYSPWSDAPGSAFDFRLDWMAACAMGVTLAAALRADKFQSTLWSGIFGLAVGLTLLVRFLSGTYFAVIYLFLLIWILFGATRWRRAANLLFSGMIATAVAGPLMWISRQWIYTYYLIGHFTGPESALRSSKMGLKRSVAWILSRLADNHLGHAFFWCAGATAGVAVIGLFFSGDNSGEEITGPHVQRQDKQTESPSVSLGPWIFVSLIFFLVPTIILTLHQEKSNAVLGIIIPGILTTMIGAGAWIAGRLGANRFSAPMTTRYIFGATAMALGTFHFLRAVTDRPVTADFERDARKVNLLSDLIYTRAKAAGLSHPRIAVDRVTDCLDGQVLRVICYERKKEWVPFIMTLPTGIMEENEALLMERLTQSDFVFLTEDGPVGQWPYDRQMKALHLRAGAWCDQNLKRVEDFELFQHRMVLYQRKEIP